MALQCTACGLDIYPGHEVTTISRGLVKHSNKSGRCFQDTSSSDPIHADIACHILYLSQRNLCDSGQLVDSLTEMVRARIEPDVKVEIEDEYRQGKMEELREELIDELGRTCAVCNEEIEDVRQAIDEDDFIPHPQEPPGFFAPVPIPKY